MLHCTVLHCTWWNALLWAGWLQPDGCKPARRFDLVGAGAGDAAGGPSVALERGAGRDWLETKLSDTLESIVPQTGRLRELGSGRMKRGSEWGAVFGPDNSLSPFFFGGGAGLKKCHWLRGINLDNL